MTTAGFERWRENFAQLIENLVGRRIDYSNMYPAVVVLQNSNGTLQVLPDDEKIRGTGLDAVPIRHGLPGISVTVSQGARVRIGFEAEDPGRPYAALWDTNAAFVSITFDQGTQAIARQGDLVQSGGVGTICTFAPVPGSPTAFVTPGFPYFVSFDAILPTPVLAAPLFGAVATGKSEVKA